MNSRGILHSIPPTSSTIVKSHPGSPAKSITNAVLNSHVWYIYKRIYILDAFISLLIEIVKFHLKSFILQYHSTCCICRSICDVRSFPKRTICAAHVMMIPADHYGALRIENIFHGYAKTKYLKQWCYSHSISFVK